MKYIVHWQGYPILFPPKIDPMRPEFTIASEEAPTRFETKEHAAAAILDMLPVVRRLMTIEPE